MLNQIFITEEIEKLVLSFNSALVYLHRFIFIYMYDTNMILIYIYEFYLYYEKTLPE